MQLNSLDIILPCFNPSDGWGEHVVKQVGDIQQSLPDTTCRLILVNDGSIIGFTKDQIDHIKQNLPESLIIDQSVNRGKGAALREGFRHSNADHSIYTDIDFPYTTASLLGIYNDLKDGNDIVAGIKGPSYYEQVPTGRKFISRFLRFLTRIFLGLKITDTQCGLKGMNRKGRETFLTTTIDRYLFDLEFIYLASHDKEVTIKPRTIELRSGIRFSSMPMKILVQESLNFVRIIFKRFG